MDNAFFSVEQKKLSHILSSMQAICAKRTTLDTTTTILFQAGHRELVLKSTDLELSLQYSCPFQAQEAIENVQFLVPGKRVFELTRELEGEIEFNVQDNQVALSAGKAQLVLNVKDAQEFPPFPERIENLIDIKTEHLLALIERVAFVVPQNNANPALNGVLLTIGRDGMSITATDGHCLSHVTTTAYTLQEEKKWLLPRRAIFELKRILDASKDEKIFLGVCGNQIVFSGESFNLFSKLLIDAFPEFTQIMSKEGFTRWSAPKGEFAKALRRSACLLSGQFIATEFNFDHEHLEVIMHNKEVGKLKEDLTLTEAAEKVLSIRFYAPYVLNGLQVLPGDYATFWLHNKTRPIIFEADDEYGHMIFLVMPVSPVNYE